MSLSSVALECDQMDLERERENMNSKTDKGMPRSYIHRHELQLDRSMLLVSSDCSASGEEATVKHLFSLVCTQQ